MAKKSELSWSRDPSNSLLHRIEEHTHHSPLKEKIAQAEFRLRNLRQNLEEGSSRMQLHEKQLFEKCVIAQSTKDDAHAVMYANECAQVRKMLRTLLSSELAIEQVMIRLETVEDFGDMMTEMTPVTHVIRALKGNLSGVVPEVSFELGTVGEMLNGVLGEAGAASDFSSVGFESANYESKKILDEATSVADQKLKDRLPELPSAQRTSGMAARLTS